MATSDEVAAEAWLDLAEYARELTDKLSGIRTKQTMLALAKLCETLALHHLDHIGQSLSRRKRGATPNKVVPLKDD
jgi:hypothetical protein